jgi:hypothetical protein
LLDLNAGDVNIVSREIGVSPSWVSRVKLAHKWVPKDPQLTAIVAPPPALPETTHDREVVPFIAPDTVRVITLRTEVLDLLTTKVKEQDLKPREAIKLLEVLLMYENSLRATMAPNLNIYNDNRKQTVHVSALVEALSEKLDIDQLRMAAGVAAPLNIIEGEVIQNA